MAKKGKIKKSGMEKRRQDKRHKKMVKRKKLMSHKSPAQITSPHQLEKLLKTLPNLAFDPMLQDLYFDEQMMQELIGQDLQEPQMLSRLLTPDFLEELGRRLEDVEDSAIPQSPKALLAKASRHQLEHSEEIPHLSNPLLFAFFLKTRAKAEGTPMTIADLPQAIKNFEERNADWIAEASENPELLKNDLEEDSAETIEETQSEVFPKEVKLGLDNYVGALSSERAERMKEDLELFLDDFGPPPVKEWNGTMIDQFYQEWFVEHANPTDDDRLSMRETMLHLIRFLQEQKLLGDDFSPNSLQES